MQNDQLRLQLSFMPPQMWNQICDARDNKSPQYRDQRTNPQYLIPQRNTEFFFDSADPNDPRISRLQRYAAVASVTGLLNEVDEAMEYVKTHSGVEVDYSQEDGEIAEEAIDDTSVAPKRRADKAIPDIADNESATKRSHYSIMPPGHVIHPSKTQRIAPTVEPPPSDIAPQVASTFGDMADATNHPSAQDKRLLHRQKRR